MSVIYEAILVEVSIFSCLLLRWKPLLQPPQEYEVDFMSPWKGYLACFMDNLEGLG